MTVPAELGLLARPYRRLVIGVFLVSTFIAFEQMSVATVLPAVVARIGGLDLYGWAFSAFMLAQLVGIVAAGRVIDRIGCATPLLASSLLFSVGLLIDGTAASMSVLVCGRAVQGLGAGTIAVVVNAAVGRSLPWKLRPRAFAALAVAWVLPSVIGPAIAGLVAQAWTWRAVFLGVIPAVLAGLAVARPAIRESDRLHRERYAAAPGAGVAMRTMLVTAALLTVGAAAAIEAANSRLVAVVAVGGAIGLVSLWIGVRRTLPPSATVLGRHQRAAAWVGGLCFAAFFGAESLLPLTITSVHGRRLVEAGAVLTVAAVTWTAGSWAQARLVDRLSPRRLSVVGVALIAVGISAVFAIDWSATPWWVGFVAWGLAPAGMGILTPLMSIVVVGGEDGVFGEPLATLQLLITLGEALGAGAAGAAIAWSARIGDGITPGLRIFDLVAVCAALAALLAAVRLPAARGTVADKPVTCEHADHGQATPRGYQ